MLSYVPVVLLDSSVYVFRNSAAAMDTIEKTGGAMVCAEVSGYPDTIKDIFLENHKATSVKYDIENLPTMWGDLYDTLRGRYID